jgi:hypothetical protein
MKYVPKDSVWCKKCQKHVSKNAGPHPDEPRVTVDYPSSDLRSTSFRNYNSIPRWSRLRNNSFYDSGALIPDRTDCHTY